MYLSLHIISILYWRHTCLLFEEAAHIRWVIEVELRCYTLYREVGTGEIVLNCHYHLPIDILLGRCFPVHLAHLIQVVGRDGEHTCIVGNLSLSFVVTGNEVCKSSKQLHSTANSLLLVRLLYIRFHLPIYHHKEGKDTAWYRLVIEWKRAVTHSPLYLGKPSTQLLYWIEVGCNMGCSIIKFQKGISEILYSISSQCRSVTHLISAWNSEDAWSGINVIPMGIIAMSPFRNEYSLMFIDNTAHPSTQRISTRPLFSIGVPIEVFKLLLKAFTSDISLPFNTLITLQI